MGTASWRRPRWPADTFAVVSILAAAFVLFARIAGTQPAVSLDDVVAQNSGRDTGLRGAGVPSTFDWYSRGWAPTGPTPPPPGFTALTGWGAIYPQEGRPHATCNVHMRGFRTYVHRKAGGWALVQAQDTHRIVGGHFVADFAENAAKEMAVTREEDGAVVMPSPPARFNDHFWPDPRGTYEAESVDGAFVLMELRVDASDCHLVVNAGADWWRDASIGYAHPVGTNNPAVGLSSWVKLGTEFTYVYYTNLRRADLLADPPPPLGGRPQ